MQAALSRPVHLHAPPSPADDRLFPSAAQAARNAQTIRERLRSERDVVATELAAVASADPLAAFTAKKPNGGVSSSAAAWPTRKSVEIDANIFRGLSSTEEVPGGGERLADVSMDDVSDIGTSLLSMAPKAQALYKETLARRLASEIVEVDHDPDSDSSNATSFIAPSTDGPYRLGLVSSAVALASNLDVEAAQPLPRRADVVPEEPNIVFLVSRRPTFKRVWKEGHAVRSKMAVCADPIDPL